MSKAVRRTLSVAAMIGAAAAAFVLLIYAAGSTLPKALEGFRKGAFGSTYSIGEVLVKSAPLILCALSVSVGTHAGFTNIGAEGQFLVGATVTAFIGMYATFIPSWALLPVSMLAGFLAGGLWAMIPGLLKAYLGISEVINTIMFNYIAACLTGICLQTVLKAPDAYFPVSAYMPEGLKLGVILPGTRLHAGFIVAIVCAALVYVLIWRTYLGYRIRVVGQSPRVGTVAGIGVKGTLVISSLLSGGFAGLAGVCEIAGLQHRLLDGISPGYGYLAIVAALLGGNHPLGIVLASAGIALLQVGASGMQRSAGIPTAIANILLGGIVLLILGRKMFEKRLADRRKKA